MFIKVLVSEPRKKSINCQQRGQSQPAADIEQRNRSDGEEQEREIVSVHYASLGPRGAAFELQPKPASHSLLFGVPADFRIQMNGPVVTEPLKLRMQRCYFDRVTDRSANRA